MWAKGDYGEIARWLVPAAEALAASAAVPPGSRAVDVAAGTGNVAVALAARGARVTAVDIEPELVGLGRERTQGMTVEWVVGDALALPFEPASFDAALSAFGVMYVPDAHGAAAELARVVRPSGTVGVASWTRDGFQGRASAAIPELLGRTADPGPGLWGDETAIEPVLAAFLDELRLERRTLQGKTFRDAEEWWAHADRHAPPLAALREAVDRGTYAKVGSVLTDLAREFAMPAEGGVAIEQEYLIAVGVVR